MNWLKTFAAWLKNLYQTNLKFRGVVQAIEGGLIVGFLTATANGLDLSHKGLEALCAAFVGGVITAIRNYFLNPPAPAPVAPVIEMKKQGEPH